MRRLHILYARPASMRARCLRFLALLSDCRSHGPRLSEVVPTGDIELQRPPVPIQYDDAAALDDFADLAHCDLCCLRRDGKRGDILWRDRHQHLIVLTRRQKFRHARGATRDELPRCIRHRHPTRRDPSADAGRRRQAAEVLDQAVRNIDCRRRELADERSNREAWPRLFIGADQCMSRRIVEASSCKTRRIVT